MCDCLCGQYRGMPRLSCAEHVCLHYISTIFLIAFSAAAADHHSPVPKGLHHRPPREYRHPLRGEGKASPHVSLCEVWFLHSSGLRCGFNHHLSGFRQMFLLTTRLRAAPLYSESSQRWVYSYTYCRVWNFCPFPFISEKQLIHLIALTLHAHTFVLPYLQGPSWTILSLYTYITSQTSATSTICEYQPHC